MIDDRAVAVRLLANVADSYAAKAEKQNIILDRNAWKKWATTGQSTRSGAKMPSRAAFQWIRSPCGWTKPMLAEQQLEDSVPEEKEAADEFDTESAIRDPEASADVIWRPNSRLVPLGAQAQVDKTASAWAKLWAEEAEYRVETDTIEPGSLQPLCRHALRMAAKTFPPHTGLGADNLAPRSLDRLSDEALDALALIFNEAEKSGSWGEALRLVLIVLIPKSDGDLRPIGLLPTPVRVWMRARAPEARAWERLNHRDNVYAGPAMGAQRAAWQTAFQAESSALNHTDYAQTNLDIVKAFEKIKHFLIIRAAKKHGYDMQLLRLSLAAYRAPRAIGVNGVFSRLIIATTGITAGSGFATTELRLLLIDMVDDSYVMFRYLSIKCMFYVDDVTIEAFGIVGKVHLKSSAASTYMITYFQDKLDLEVSAKKSGVVTSKPKLADKIVAMDSTGKMKALKVGKVLGVCGTGGVRRCTEGQRSRVSAAGERNVRIHAMRNAGVCAAHVVRTTFPASMLFDACCNGVADGMLRTMRTTAARGMAPPTRGKNYELVLYAGDSAGGRADPAFEAHALPIKFWALAWWQSWRTHDELEDAHAKATHKLLHTRGSVWQAVTGSATAVIASAWRIGWRFTGARQVVTECGRHLDFLVDSPEAIVQAVYTSVRRWRLGRILNLLPALKPKCSAHVRPKLGDGTVPPRGYDIHNWVPPDWNDCPWVLGRLLHGRSSTVKSVAQWDRSCRSYLTSTVVGGQWSQSRLFNTKRQWVPDNVCQLCGLEVGTLGHRRCCTVTRPVGGWPEQPADAKQFTDQLAKPALRLLQDRGLVVIRAVLPARNPPESLHWQKWFGSSELEEDATWYIDGSLLDGPRALTAATGAGFAAVSSRGALVAYGHGTPPPWATTIPAVEAWAFSVVLHNTVARRAVVTDCLGNVRILERGAGWATAAKRPMARIWGPIFLALDDLSQQGLLTWMPAHTSTTDIGERTKSDKAVLTAVDHRANALVDGLAKFAAEGRRASEYIRKMVKSAELAVEHAAAVIGASCKAANSHRTVSTDSDGVETVTITRDATPLLHAARAAAKIEVRQQRAAAVAKAAEDKMARIRAEKEERADQRRRDRAEDNARREERLVKASKLSQAANTWAGRPGSSGDSITFSATAPHRKDDGVESRWDCAEEMEHTLLEADESHWWENLDEGMDLATKFEPEEANHPRNDVDSTMDVETLFEPEEANRSEKMDDEKSTRSQVRLTVDQGGSVGRAEAHTPVAELQDAAAPAKKKAKTKEAASSTALSAAELWKKVRVSEAEAKLPTSTPGGSLIRSEDFRTPQQLNAQRQNAKRAREKVAWKESQRAVEGAATLTKEKSAVGGKAAGPPRLLDTVAEFWAKKKARLAGGACSAEGRRP